jgi:hypothetical protein
MKKVKVIDFVKLNEIEIKNKLIELDFFIDEEDVEEVEFVENIDDEEICGGEDCGFDFSFKKSKLKEWVEDDNIIKLNINNKVLYCCYYDF